MSTIEDYGILDVGEHRTRLLASFTSPTEHPQFTHPNNTTFRIRCTMPHSPACGRDGKHRSVLVLLNGLGEADVTPYDELCDELAELGLASLLLPLPGHFSRHPGQPPPDPASTEPSDVYQIIPTQGKDRSDLINERSTSILALYQQEPRTWIESYRQAISDLLLFFDRIRGISPAHGSFLPAAFGPNTRLSLYGYSLGGLIAISATLLRPNLIHSCFVINSGCSLSDVDANRIFDNQWDQIKKGIRRAFEQYPAVETITPVAARARSRRKDTQESASTAPARRTTPRDTHDGVFPYSKEFEQVFLGDHPDSLNARIARLCRRILFVLGVKDDVFRIADVQRLGTRDTGITLLQLPAIGHYIDTRIQDRMEWTRWRPFLASFLVSFEQSHPPDDFVAGLLDTCIDCLRDFAAPGEFLRARAFLYESADNKLIAGGSSSNISDNWEASFPLAPGQGLVGQLFEKHRNALSPEEAFAVGDVQAQAVKLGWDAERGRLLESQITTVAAFLVWSPHMIQERQEGFIGAVALASNYKPVASVLRTQVACNQLRTAALALGDHIGMRGGLRKVLTDLKTEVQHDHP